MNRLSSRLADLEARANPPPTGLYVIPLYHDQTNEEAVAAYEASHGVIPPDSEGVLRVIIHKPFAAPEPVGSHAA